MMALWVALLVVMIMVVTYTLPPIILRYISSKFFHRNYQTERGYIADFNDDNDEGRDILAYYQYDRSGRMGGS